MAVQLSQAYLEWEQETLERGRLTGELQGKIKGKLEAVPSLLEQGFSVEKTALILGLTVEQVESARPQ